LHLSRLVLWPRRWSRYVPPKSRLAFNGLDDVISTRLYSSTAVVFEMRSLGCYGCRTLPYDEHSSHPKELKKTNYIKRNFIETSYRIVCRWDWVHWYVGH
jgi:hypothetical protein